VGNVVLKPTRIPPRNSRSSFDSPRTPRRRKSGRFWKGALVTVGAMLLAVFLVKASDTFRPPGNNLLAGVGGSTKEARCPDDMVYVSDPNGGFCIDRYEASAGKLCPVSDPGNQFDTTNNLSQKLCTPVSVQNAYPWTNVPESQSVELCARVGKHLPSNSEWYRAALGTPDEADESGKGCVLGRIGASHSEKTGTHEACVSSFGVYDMVGNVWEWIDANVVDGSYAARTLPDEGYVSEVDIDGVAIKTSTSTSEIFHGDTLSLNRVGVMGMFRGGFWNMTDKAGTVAINAASAPSFTGIAVGFRCAR